MMQYIDKSALVAEIERGIKINKECMLGLRNLDYYQGKVDALNDTISFIDTLEVKEVDLENKWIDCSERMPEETMRNSDFLQVQQEWNESEKVLAYDSMYGARVDYTVNGKWHSELQRGVGGQILHGIIAWMPIPKYV